MLSSDSIVVLKSVSTDDWLIAGSDLFDTVLAELASPGY